MPFSIKRLTQVHRSSSMPSNKNKQSDNENKSKKKNKDTSGHNSGPNTSTNSNASQAISLNKQKLSQISSSRSIDSAEIRRIGQQLTISNPIPIDPNRPKECLLLTNTLPIRWSKTGPHSAPKSIHQIQHENRSAGYYSDAEESKSGQQRRVLKLIRNNGQQQHTVIQSTHNSQPVVQQQAQQAIRMSQPLPNLTLLKSGGSHPTTHSVIITGGQRPSNPALHSNQEINQSSTVYRPRRPASATPLDRGVFGLRQSSSLFDDDPGIMSEIETSATGFRRGNKVRSSLPIVRTPSKTQDRSLGLVFLQFRTETKRALLPNEITSLDTVKALFVRSFPRQLSMEYLDCPSIRIYIHDPSKDMFYELEDLRDIRDRCVLRIYEHGVNGPQPVGGDTNLPIPWSDSEQFGYFSEPEFESEYQSQHVHRPKRVTGQLPTSGGQSQYYGTIILPAQYRSQTMSRGNYSVDGSAQPPQPPERSKPFPVISSNGPPPKPQRSFPGQSRSSIVTPPRSVTTPSVIGSQYHQNRPLPDRPYSVAGQYPSPERNRQYQQDFSGYLSSPERRMPPINQTQVRSSFSGYPSVASDDPYGVYGMRSGAATPVIDEEARVRMQAMERQLVSLTNVVTKALTPAQTVNHKSEKSGKPAPPPKPASLIGYRGEAPMAMTCDMFSQLKNIRKKTKDLRGEVRALRRMALQQTTTAKEALRETCHKIKTTLSFLSDSSDCQLRLERMRISHDRDSYGHDFGRLDKDLHELESQVEELRSNVINRRCRVNMSHVESMALVLSRASKTVADLKNRFPQLSQTLKTTMTQEMEHCVKEEKFLKEEPDRLETALKRCKKLTGTLVTLKRLASVQEQRSTTNSNSSSPSTQLLQSTSTDSGERDLTARSYDNDMEPHTIIHVTPATPLAIDSSKSNVLDTLLDELQTFSKPSQQSSQVGGQSVRKLVQAMTSVDSGITKKGPQQMSTIPTPPPRSSSRINPIVLSSFAVRPPSYSSIRSNSEPPMSTANRPRSTPPEGVIPDCDEPLVPPSSSTSSLSSVGSQGSVVEKRFAQSRQELLEQRHQELLRKQKQLQEQYTRLQQLSRGQIPRGLLNDLKKTGSESNIVSKTSLNMNAVHGSLRDLAINSSNGVIDSQQKIFETDIL